MLRIFLFISLFFFSSFFGVFAAENNLEQDINIRDITIGENGQTNSVLEEFTSPIENFFFTPDTGGGEGIVNVFASIAFQIKNFFIAIAVIFLIIGVLKLLFSSNDEEAVKKWKSNIIWVSVWVFVMQIAFSVWNTFIIKDVNQEISSTLGFQIWINVFAPIVALLQMLASLAFLFMAVYAFFLIVTGAGDEEKMKKWRRTIIYGLIGFFLIRIPQSIVSALYGSPDCRNSGIFTVWSCEIEKQNLSGVVEIVGKIINYFNGFLFLICVLLIIYAGWLVLISAGDEEKMKKAKNTIIYVFVGFVVLVASHALFRFFILRG